MRRKRKDSSLVIIALESRWPMAAAISATALLSGYVLLPVLFARSPVLSPLGAMLQPVCLIIALIFGIMALVKWLGEKTQGNEQAAPETITFPARRRTKIEPSEHNTPPPHVAEPRPTAWSLELIQTLEWKRFEELCQRFYAAKGIRSECTPLGPDGGIDIHLYQDDSGNATAIVQCKAWRESFVGVKPIRELLGVMVHEKVGKAFFMTSGKYSEDAKSFAKANRITLIDGSMLLAMLLRLPETDRQSLLEFATSDDYDIPTCPACGTKMQLITGKSGKRDFWGCRNFPKCRGKLGARQGAIKPLSTATNPA